MNVDLDSYLRYAMIFMSQGMTCIDYRGCYLCPRTVKLYNTHFMLREDVIHQIQESIENDEINIGERSQEAAFAHSCRIIDDHYQQTRRLFDNDQDTVSAKTDGMIHADI